MRNCETGWLAGVRSCRLWIVASVMLGGGCVLHSDSALQQQLDDCGSEASRSPAVSGALPANARVQLVYDDQEHLAKQQTDTNGDGVFDELVYYSTTIPYGVPERAERDSDHDGEIDLWITYGADGSPVRWKWLTEPGGAPVETADRDVATKALSAVGAPIAASPHDRAGFDGDRVRECLTRPAVQEYQREIRESMYRKWSVFRGGSVVMAFTLRADGEVAGMCVRHSDSKASEKEAVRALLAAAPFPPMSEEVSCLAGQRLVGKFETR